MFMKPPQDFVASLSINQHGERFIYIYNTHINEMLD